MRVWVRLSVGASVSGCGCGCGCGCGWQPATQPGRAHLRLHVPARLSPRLLPHCHCHCPTPYLLPLPLPLPLAPPLTYCHLPPPAGEAPLLTLTFTFVDDVAPPAAKTLWFGVLGVFPTLGVAAGFVAAEPLVAGLGGWRGPFYLEVRVGACVGRVGRGGMCPGAISSESPGGVGGAGRGAGESARCVSGKTRASGQSSGEEYACVCV